MKMNVRGRAAGLIKAACMIAVLSALFVVGAANASAETSGACGYNLTWTIDGASTLTISGTGEMYDYSYFGQPWLEQRESITSVVIENGVTYIGENAFSGGGLTSVTIPQSVTAIGRDAFSGCSNLDSVYITDIGAYLTINYGNDSACPNTTKLYVNGKRLINLDIPDTVTAIPNYAFSGCDSIKSATIPDSVTSIGNYAFSGCTVLTSITIPDSVTSIGDHVFDGCTSLTSVTIGNSITAIGNYAFSDCTGLTSMVVPDSVESIGYNAFNKCGSLTSVTIGSGVASIGNDAFSFCSNLESVYINDLGNWCQISFGINGANPLTYADKFYLNNNLVTELVIPNNVESISSDAFYGYDGLTRVTIGNGVTSIGNSAFSDCNNLASVDIGSGVTSIGEAAFDGCSSLTSITIPENVTYIGGGAFGNCESLKTVNYNAIQCVLGSSMYYSSIFGGRYYMYNSPISTLKVGENVQKIPSRLCASLSTLNTVFLGNSVASVDANAFIGCTDLQRIYIPKSTVEIETSAFSYCDALETVEYGGGEEDWNEIYIGTDNDPLKNAQKNYYSIYYASSSKPAVIKTENDGKWSFSVTPERAYADSFVYAAIYDEDGKLIEINRVSLEMSGATVIETDKSAADKTAKIFVWTKDMQPITAAEDITL